MFPESFPECFPEEIGVRSGIMDADSKRALPPNNFKTPPKERQQKKMARDLMQGKRMYDRMKNQARQQLALMNKCRMRKQGGKGVANQPFYVQFPNR